MNETPLTLSWEQIPRLDFDVGIACEDTAATDHVLAAVTQEPIVEFLESKVGVYTKFFELENYHIPISQFIFDILGHYQIHLSQLPVIGAAKVDERIFPIVVEWRTNALKHKMPSADFYSEANVTTLNTHHTPIQKQPEALLCLVGLSQSYFLRDDVYPTFLYDDDRDMDLFNLISASNPTKVKTETRPRVAHEVPLLTATASRVKDMEDTTDGLSHGILHVENEATTKVVLEPSLEKEVAAMGPRVNRRRRKRGNDKAEANAPPKVLRKDHAAFRPAQSTLRVKPLAPLGFDAGFTFATHVTHEAHTAAKSVSDPDPLSYTKPQPHPELDIAYHTNKSHVLHNVDADLLGKRLPRSPPEMLLPQGARPVLRGESGVREINLLPLHGQVARRSHITAETKNLETLLEAKVDMKKAVEAKNAKLTKELESLRIQFSDLQVSNSQLSQQHGKVGRDLMAIKAYDPEADSKYVKALQDLKDLKYPLVDQLERLKDAPMELIITSLYLESDSREDVP
nr:hypothetical protein [Tanacetum cinerariifolium]